MHTINTSTKELRTNLIIEQDFADKIEEINEFDNIKVTKTTVNNDHFTTITFQDTTDKTNFEKVKTIFIKELRKYLTPTKDDRFLVIGLGNNNSTPDSLGPKTIDNVLATRHLFLLGDVEKSYSNVSKFKPSVIGETGIESIKILKSIVKEIKPTKVIIIDSLKASKIERLNRVIQITNSGIHPGSGINNNRGEISKKTMDAEIIAIGIPTVVDVRTIVEDLLKEEISLKENLIVTPTNIDYLIDNLSLLIANGINNVLHNTINDKINT